MAPELQRAPAPSRIRILIAVAFVVPLGMLVRQVPGEVGNLSASACFTLFFALVLMLVAPRLRGGAAAALAFTIAAFIELAQLTPVPGVINAVLPPAYWLFGTTFAPLDLVGYALGAALVVGLARLAVLDEQGDAALPVTTGAVGVRPLSAAAAFALLGIGAFSNAAMFLASFVFDPTENTGDHYADKLAAVILWMVLSVAAHTGATVAIFRGLPVRDRWSRQAGAAAVVLMAGAGLLIALGWGIGAIGNLSELAGR